jgi:hypothetical protein
MRLPRVSVSFDRQPTKQLTVQGYQSVPTSTSFDYVDSRPYQAEMTSPLLGEAPFASSGTIDVNNVQPASFAWDSTPNLREYPPLQPTTTGEDMVYPVAIADSRFSRTQDTESRFPASGPQGGPQSKPQSSGLTDNGLPYLGGVMPVTGASSFGPTEPRSLGASSGFGRVPGYLAVETTSPGHAGRVDLQSRTSGLDVVFPNQRPPPAKRGPFKTHMARQQTAHTRKIGSCIRCRMQRIRVWIPQTTRNHATPRFCMLPSASLTVLTVSSVNLILTRRRTTRRLPV